MNSSGQTKNTSAKKKNEQPYAARQKLDWQKPLSTDGSVVFDDEKLKGVSETKILLLCAEWLRILVWKGTLNLPESVRSTPDIAQDASIALLKCWRTYQTKRLDRSGIEFKAYAYLSVKGAIVDSFRDRKFMKARAKGYVTWFTPLELAHREVAAKEGISLNKQIDLEHVLLALELWERRFLNLFYAKGMSLKEIGALGEISESRACQLHTGILNKMRKLWGVDPSECYE